MGAALRLIEVAGIGGIEWHEHTCHEFAEPATVQSRDTDRGTQPQAVELRLGELGGQALGFIHGYGHRLVGTAKLLGNALVGGGQSLFIVDDEDDGVGFIQRDFGLPGR